jgi:hypothetical protein
LPTVAAPSFSLALFGISLTCVLVSWFMVTHRELKRRDVALGEAKPKRADESGPVFSHWPRSWWWDIAGAVSAAARCDLARDRLPLVASHVSSMAS